MTEQDLIDCPFGNEYCDKDDYETMCDDCKIDRAESLYEAMKDTYD